MSGHSGNVLVLYSSGVTSDIPANTNLSFGELSLNYADGALYYLKSNTTIGSFITVDASDLLSHSNDAFVQSNSAWIAANTANASYTRAITANVIAKQSSNQANAAFAQANTANGVAKAAYNDANSAIAVGNSAFAFANTLGNVAFVPISQVAFYPSASVNIAGIGARNSSVIKSSATGGLSANSNISGITANGTQTWGDNTATVATDAFVRAAFSQIRVNVAVFTANGIWVPDTNLIFAVIEAVGGGGGGGASTVTGGNTTGAGGGGSGAYSRITINVATAGTSQAINIGQGGPGNLSPQNAPGANAGNTIVGSLLVAPGGFGGSGGEAPGIVWGQGGLKGTGDYSQAGMPGDPGILGTSSVNWATSGSGGSSRMGGGGAGVQTFSSGVVGNPARTVSGGGGAGAASDGGSGAQDGGNGQNGQVVITQICWG